MFSIDGVLLITELPMLRGWSGGRRSRFWLDGSSERVQNDYHRHVTARTSLPFPTTLPPSPPLPLPSPPTLHHPHRPHPHHCPPTPPRIIPQQPPSILKRHTGRLIRRLPRTRRLHPEPLEVVPNIIMLHRETLRSNNAFTAPRARHRGEFSNRCEELGFVWRVLSCDGVRGRGFERLKRPCFHLSSVASGARGEYGRLFMTYRSVRNLRPDRPNCWRGCLWGRDRWGELRTRIRDHRAR